MKRMKEEKVRQMLSIRTVMAMQKKRRQRCKLPRPLSGMKKSQLTFKMRRRKTLRKQEKKRTMKKALVRAKETYQQRLRLKIVSRPAARMKSVMITWLRTKCLQKTQYSRKPRSSSTQQRILPEAAA